ncbi:MAG: hypothetical protein ABIJ09_02505 [Pseudomonadota bacterium]
MKALVLLCQRAGAPNGRVRASNPVRRATQPVARHGLVTRTPCAIGLLILAMAACLPVPPATGDAGPGADARWSEQDESEPNNGTTTEEFNGLAIGTRAHGVLQLPDDVDIFRFDAELGGLYVVSLTPDPDSSLQPHLTVMDSGVGTAPAGNSYIKILRSHGEALIIETLAMGVDGFFAVVRDARNVGGAGGAGDADARYSLTVQAVDRSQATVGALSFTSTQSGLLRHAGAVDLYTFEGTSWSDLLVDLRATGDLDGRLFVFADATGDWIARNDNRSQGDVDPLIDAPLTEGGSLLLVVENIAEQAADLRYTVDASWP